MLNDLIKLNYKYWNDIIRSIYVFDDKLNRVLSPVLELFKKEIIFI